jgi:hypothetical protein
MTGETPPGGDPQGASFARPCHACTDPPEPPCHTEPQPTTASHCDRPQVPQHTKPRQPLPLVPEHSTQPNCPHGPRHTASPDPAVISMFLGAARPHQCPLHQPGPLHAGQVATVPHTHAPARPTPCKCRQCPTPNPVSCSPDATAGPQHKATTQHHPTAPTLDSAAEPPDAVAPPCSYRPHTASNLLAMLARR